MGENIRYDREIPDEFYDITDGDEESENENRHIKKGRPKKLKTMEEFFMVYFLWSRRGFSIRHLSHLFGVAPSTVSRSFKPGSTLCT